MQSSRCKKGDPRVALDGGRTVQGNKEGQVHARSLRLLKDRLTASPEIDPSVVKSPSPQ